ncbi:hypothetical protein IWX47DRAFT_871078 [Phyllosticta citricarpa]
MRVHHSHITPPRPSPLPILRFWAASLTSLTSLFLSMWGHPPGKECTRLTFAVYVLRLSAACRDNSFDMNSCS